MFRADPLAAIVVLTTLPAEADAEAFARALVEERLAACVNLLPPMHSFYRWQGHIEGDRECQVVIKTSPARLDALRARVAALHPYDVPEFLVLPVTGGSDAYLGWLAASVTDAGPE